MNEMPEFKPLPVDKRIERAAAAEGPLHHSLTDWDFQNVSWTLSATVYHTAAPSLIGTAAGAALIKNATTGALSDGRLIIWTRTSTTSALLRMLFRNQAADGDANLTSTYYIYVVPTAVSLYVYLTGSPILLSKKNMTWTWDINTWYKLRVTWWTTAAKLYVRVERWNGSAWVTLGGDADVDFEDANDRWKGNPVNRCGVHYANVIWSDDLEVWG